ncbi:MAG: DNA polymerase III subunit gamma/tau [Firmicutes bacterium HGW-Firmicutes-9]|jgi:DNA polymerase-3 subunit gamma/tau|nr:MAG: DNA polymerase III subunit gamma/tau [Firmicutes bacterium HGW-Firmicutes-9]
MAYRALYRQYRPARFADVIGQEHITTTLKHQVSSDRPAHAYLFCGTRGTGKTTSARILARAVNCLSPEEGEPCGKCEACLITAAEGASDITEIDAASNNSVNDVRDLIENSQYAPLNLRRRVFIIDEVHMLSGAAFNALLKTLEEPPEHILFILATTEPQKLPATIISRCQRFDFHRLSITDIKSTLKSVLSQAGASIEDGGLTLIARAAQGGMRDALSLADQCLAFCGDVVTTKNVYDVLGSMEDSFLFEISKSLLASNAPEALRMLDSIMQAGRDLSVFAADLAAHFRALLLSKTCGRCEDLLDCTEDTMTRYLEQAKGASEARLMLALDRLIAAQNDMRYLPSPRALLESALVHICRPEDSVSLANIEARLDRLEAQIKEGLPAQAPAQQAVSPEPAKQTTVEAPVSQPAQKPEPTPAKAEPAQEAAPWTDLTPPPETWSPEDEYTLPPQEEIVKIAPKPDPVPAKAAHAPKPASKPSGSTDAAGIWREAIANIPNMFVQALAREAVALHFENNTLTVGFTDAQEMKHKSLNAPINFEPTQRALQAVKPDAKLVITTTKKAPASGQAEELAKALFGDKLTIE